jgi:hypothetical protein
MSRTASSIANSTLDPTEAIVGYNGGRLRVFNNAPSSATLQFFGAKGPYIEVATRRINIETPLACAITDFLILADGTRDTIAPSNDTLYFAYVSAFGELALSETAPSNSATSVGLYLSDTIGGRVWRFVGWVRTGTAVFEDSDTRRCVSNFENQVPKRIFFCPDYADDNATTTYDDSSATWAPLAGVASPIVAIGGGLLGTVDLELIVSCSAVGAGGAQIGIEASGISDVRFAGALLANGVIRSSACRLVARFDGEQVVTIEPQFISAAVSTFVADNARNGALADPPMTYVTGWVLG